VLSMPDIQSYVHGSLEFTGSSARSASLSHGSGRNSLHRSGVIRQQ
jgi:hypothetical protein